MVEAIWRISGTTGWSLIWRKGKRQLGGVPARGVHFGLCFLYRSLLCPRAQGDELVFSLVLIVKPVLKHQRFTPLFVVLAE